MAKISVIVPVYNSERFVGATLDSLLAQTHHDLQIICVDDGSVDGSRAVLDEYAARDGRIAVIAQKNQGVSAARNAGIDQAIGDILMFVDADDTLVPNACEHVAAAFEDGQIEMLTFGLVCDPPEAAPASLRRELAPPNKTYEGFEPSLLFKDSARPYACRSAISRTFAEREHVRFESGIALGEDQVFYFATYPFSKKTALMPDQLYIYRMNSDSATHAATNDRAALLKKLDQHLRVIEAIEYTWAQHGMRDFCADELLEWCLDFLMLDISKLPADDQRTLYARLLEGLDAFFLQQPSETHARRLFTRMCLKDIRSALSAPSRTPVVKKVHLSAFYLMRRGLIRCMERMFMKVGIIR